MTKLKTAQQTLAAHLAASVEADPIAALIPVSPAAWAGYVSPGEQWVARDVENETFCARWRISLQFDVLAAVTDLEHSQGWLNDRVEEALMCTADGVEVLPDEFVHSLDGEIVGLIRTVEGAELLVARVQFTPFTLEAE